LYSSLSNEKSLLGDEDVSKEQTNKIVVMNMFVGDAGKFNTRYSQVTGDELSKLIETHSFVQTNLFKYMSYENATFELGP